MAYIYIDLIIINVVLGAYGVWLWSHVQELTASAFALSTHIFSLGKHPSSKSKNPGAGQNWVNQQQLMFRHCVRICSNHRGRVTAKTIPAGFDSFSIALRPGSPLQFIRHPQQAQDLLKPSNELPARCI
jgi:hypothetical protein